jgi:hypothetical protein
MNEPACADELGRKRAAALKRLASQANLAHRWAAASAGASVGYIVEAGDALARARDLCLDGEWTAWVLRHFEGTLRTAQRYVRIARHWHEIGCDATRVSPQSQSEAMRMIRNAVFSRLPRAARGASTAIELPAGNGIFSFLAVGLSNLLRRAEALYPGWDDEPGRIAERLYTLRDEARQLSGCARDSEQSFIYFIEATDTNRVKIGVASDPDERLAQLQIGCATELRLLHAMPGTREDERRLHREFRAYAVGGEWFEKGPSLYEAITQLRSEGGSEPPSLAQ